MNIAGSTAFVTGANRGLGLHLTNALLDRGAATVYAAARDPQSVTVREGVVPVRVDVTDAATIEAAAEMAEDVNLLINNAGSSTGADLLAAPFDAIRVEMETHFYGTLAVTRAFAPVIESNGGGAVLNVLSALSWVSFPQIGAYSAAKSAEWSLTNALRVQLAPGITVSGLHVGFMDTDMAATVTAPKIDPRLVAERALDGIEGGDFEILADDTANQVKAGLSGPLAGFYPDLARAV